MMDGGGARMEPLKAVQHSADPPSAPKTSSPYLRWCSSIRRFAAYRMHAQLRDDYPMARRHQPPWYSSAAERIPRGRGGTAHLRQRGLDQLRRDGGDLIVDAGGALPAYVEVKATGSGEFQEIKARDLAADVLVWVAFGRRYELGHGPIDVFVLTRPQRFRPALDASGQPRRKLMLNKFLEQARVLDGFSAWRFSDIDASPE